jgi:hypothetical protein
MHVPSPFDCNLFSGLRLLYFVFPLSYGSAMGGGGVQFSVACGL